MVPFVVVVSVYARDSDSLHPSQLDVVDCTHRRRLITAVDLTASPTTIIPGERGLIVSPSVTDTCDAAAVDLETFVRRHLGPRVLTFLLTKPIVA